MKVEILENGGRIITAVGLSPSLTARSGKSYEMNKAFPTEDDVQAAHQQLHKMLRTSDAKSVSGVSGCIFISGFVLLLIPIIGWIIGPIFIIAGILSFIFPTTMSGILDREAAEKLRTDVMIRVRNCYHNLTCLYCSTPLTRKNEGFCFYADPEGFDCPFCNGRLIRNGNRLSKLD